LALFVTLLFVYDISWELLNRFAPNSQGRRVWSLALASLNVKEKGQDHQGQKNEIFPPFRRPACGLFGNTSLASGFDLDLVHSTTAMIVDEFLKVVMYLDKK